MTAFKKGDKVRVKAIWPYGGRSGIVASSTEHYVQVRIPRGHHTSADVLYRADELELLEERAK